jgi:phage recombination protein Bet
VDKRRPDDDLQAQPRPGRAGEEHMANTAELAATNGDMRISPEEYRRAVKLSMRHTEYRNGAFVDIEVTDEEVSFLLLKAAEYGLNPFKGQIYATWRDGRIQVETTLDGLRSLAQRTGEYRGQLLPEWFDGETDEWTEVWNKDEAPAAARWGVLREGFPEPVVVTVHWEEFKQTKRDGSLSAIWKEKPAHMLAKNAASLAFRAAFPGETGGIYTAEEMAGIGQVQPPSDNGGASAPLPQAPAPNPNGNGNGNGAAAIVDAPASQPSGPPATPATTGRLAAVLEQAGYSRLRADLALLVFDQQPDRLNEEQTQQLANALTAAESAGITAVEVERACKRGLKYKEVEVRRKAFYEWILERGKKAAQKKAEQKNATEGTGQASHSGEDLPAEKAPTSPDDGDPGPAAILDEEPGVSGEQ